MDDIFLSAIPAFSNDEDTPDLSEIPPSSVELFFRAQRDAQLEGRSSEPDWNEELGSTTANSFSKRAAADAPHEDGIFAEQIGSEKWTSIYKGGELIHMRCEDDELPDGVMEFDGQGNEIAA
jgi:hypothetical protein